MSYEVEEIYAAYVETWRTARKPHRCSRGHAP
jgi:hypothetical protein